VCKHTIYMPTLIWGTVIASVGRHETFLLSKNIGICLVQ
jgi:hypothetical protein